MADPVARPRIDGPFQRTASGGPSRGYPWTAVVYANSMAPPCPSVKSSGVLPRGGGTGGALWVSDNISRGGSARNGVLVGRTVAPGLLPDIRRIDRLRALS